MEPLVKKEVPDELLIKVMRFAKEHDTFTTKQLFEAYPNNQEFLLRYAIQNLRIEEKIYMFGNKRGAYYSINPNAGSEKEDLEPADPDKPNSYASKEVKELILAEAKKRNGLYFKRSELGLEEKYPIHVVIASMKQLIEDGELEVQGIRRWTEYRYSKGTEKPVTQDKPTEKNIDGNFEEKLLNYIIKAKVVTIPMLVEHFDMQRYNIIPALDSLVEKEEIYHEGNKRSSKYIHKDVPYTQVEKIVDELTEDRKITAQIDALSEFLYADEFSSVGIGLNREDKFELKFIHSGMIINRKTFDTLALGLTELKELTTVKE
jgi:hypothetical protein